MHPTVVDGVGAGDALYRTETFGPIVGVASFATFDEAVAPANGHGYGLSAAIYTNTPAPRLPVPGTRRRGDGGRRYRLNPAGAADSVDEQQPDDGFAPPPM